MFKFFTRLFSSKTKKVNTNSKPKFVPVHVENKPLNQHVETKTVTQTEKKVTMKIKGNINGKGEKIYHVPSGRYYGVINKPTMLFDSEEEAIAAGYRKSKF